MQKAYHFNNTLTHVFWTWSWHTIFQRADKQLGHARRQDRKQWKKHWVRQLYLAK